MSAMFAQAKAGKSTASPSSGSDTVAPAPLSAAEKAAADKVFGEGSPDEISAESLEAAEAISRGEIPAVASPEPKTDGVVAAEPGSEEIPPKPADAPTDDAAKAEADRLAAEEAAKTGDVVTEPTDAEKEEAAKAEKDAADKKAAEEAAAKLEEEQENEPTRMRVRRESFNSDLEWKTAQLMAREKLPLDKAAAMAREILGIQPEAAPAAEPLPEINELNGIRSQLEATYKEIDAVTLAYENEKLPALNAKIRELSRKEVEAERAVESAQREIATFERSQRRAEDEYPDAKNIETNLGARIHARFITLQKDPNNPIWNDPDRAMTVARQVAKELGIKGKSESAAPAAAATPAATPPAVQSKVPAKPQPKVTPVPGSAGTKVASITPEKTLDNTLKGFLGKDAAMVESLG